MQRPRELNTMTKCNEKQQQEFGRVLGTLIPQIERQLLKEIQQQLEMQFREKQQVEMQQMIQQAQQEYEKAVCELERSRSLLEKEKLEEILAQISQDQVQLETLRDQCLAVEQGKWLQENFQTKIMGHDKIKELQRELQEEMFQVMEEKHEQTKQRQINELILALQSKEIKLRKQLDAQIKSRVYFSSGLEDLRQELTSTKTKLGSQKSQYNLKIKKIQKEIQELKQKLKQYENVGDLQELRNKLDEMRLEMIQRDRQQHLQKDCDEDSLDQAPKEVQSKQIDIAGDQEHGRQEEKTLKRQSDNLYPLHSRKDNINIHQQSQYQDSEIQNFIAPQSKKFDLNAYFQDYLNNQSHQGSMQASDQCPKDPVKHSILQLSGISEMLKQKVSSDPLQRYITQEKSKQNDMNRHNCNQGSKSSNFASLYQEHLKKLNRNMAQRAQQSKGVRQQKQGNRLAYDGQQTKIGLSQGAKKAILRNLAQYHKETFIQNRANQLNQNSSTQKYHSYESNLLTSYK